MSSVQTLNWNKKRTTFGGGLGSLFSRMADNGKELIGSLKGEMVIKKMGQEDEDATKNMIRNILLEFGGISVDSYYFDDSLEYLYDTYTKQGANIMIAAKGSEIIGAVAVRQLTCSSGNPIEGVCELSQYYVAAEHRGQGVGCKLLERVLGEAKKLGYHGCHVSANTVFKNLEAILKHCGFEVSDIKVQQCAEKDFDRQLLKTL